MASTSRAASLTESQSAGSASRVERAGRGRGGGYSRYLCLSSVFQRFCQERLALRSRVHTPSAVAFPQPLDDTASSSGLPHCIAPASRTADQIGSCRSRLAALCLSAVSRHRSNAAGSPDEVRREPNNVARPSLIFGLVGNARPPVLAHPQPARRPDCPAKLAPPSLLDGCGVCCECVWWRAVLRCESSHRPARPTEASASPPTSRPSRHACWKSRAG